MLKKTTPPPGPAAGKAPYPAPANAVSRKRGLGKNPAKKAPVKPGTDSPGPVKREPVTFLFSRAKDPEGFERAAFVIRACSADPRRRNLSVLHVERARSGSRLVATDGLRLHVCEIPERIQAGDYKPAVTKDLIRLAGPVTGVMFPEWAKAVPARAIERGVINLEETGMGNDRNLTEKLSLAFNSFVRMTGAIINLRYLEDLTKTAWSVHCQSGSRAILLKQEGAKTRAYAVILPLRETAARAA
jgi:hypothetical protein